MKVNINIISPQEEEEVQFNIHKVDENISKAIELLTAPNKVMRYILGKNDASIFKINIKDIFYFESIDRKVFAYTKGQTYEVTEKLYVLEEQLIFADFIRISKSMLLNMEHIYSFSPKLSGNLEALLTNKEKVIISRRYVSNLKKRLGMGDGE